MTLQRRMAIKDHKGKNTFRNSHNLRQQLSGIAKEMNERNTSQKLIVIIENGSSKIFRQLKIIYNWCKSERNKMIELLVKMNNW